jgi:two-component system alkaline phosphatase synthesis response regulator PhoP
MTKVMIVDDDRTMVSLLKILLEMDGFEVVNVTQGGNFLPKVREEKPDIVLLDVFLTNMDGKELVAELRNTDDVSDMKVVMTSGMDLADQCTTAGADAFLLKPYTPEQLMSVLNENLGNTGGNTIQAGGTLE